MIGPTLSLTHCVDSAIGTFGTIVVVGTLVCVGTALFSRLFLLRLGWSVRLDFDRVEVSSEDRSDADPAC